MQRTIRILLRPTPEQAEALAETSRQFTVVFNPVCAYGWREQERNGVKLHHALYRLLKGECPALVSDLHIQARVKATEAVRSALALVRAGRKVSQPRSWACPPRYNLHTYKLDWQGQTVTLSTTGGRLHIPFSVLPHAERYVGGVDPRHTSQTCSCCGHIARNNRRSRDLFVCRACGYTLHADLNGARNIAAKYRAARGIPPRGGLPVNQPTASTPPPLASG
jgi:predicted transposase